MWNILTITISVSDGQIFDYKQLPSNTKIGDSGQNWEPNQEWQ